MSRQWKPGDVAMRVGPSGAEKLAVCVAGGCSIHIGADAHWHTVTKSGRADWDTLTFDGVTYRPLVVIDPEDREQVERLARLFRDHLLTTDDLYPGLAKSSDSLAVALREFAEPKPPKPAEPTGLGAVVEDADGNRWVKVFDNGSMWQRNDDRGVWQTYADTDAVKVLSEGVTA